MVILPPSSSDGRSSGFDRLHRGIQEWMWDNGWKSLRAAQERAIDPIMGGRDVIITAATAGGKTEAAFLPVLSRVAESPGGGIRVLNISPLRALINDQHRRLTDLGARVGVPIHRWHGDVRESERRAVLKDPSGVLVVTPESLEAMFVLRGTAMPRLFGKLEYVIIDELHAFIGSERGQQLRSLLHRIEAVARRRIPRIAMSATLGDLSVAARFLRGEKPDDVVLIESPSEGGELRLVVRGFRAPQGEEAEPEDELAIARDLFGALRGKKHLVFCNRRRDVERYTDLLRRLCEHERLPVEFHAHHGSLSKELREDAERLLKQEELPATILCTSTLELGIDVGHVESVAQIGAPASVASLRQRLGRSGRRGGPAILRAYVSEESLGDDPEPEDALRAELVQTVAVVNLLLRKWCEPPTEGALHLSTLLHQVLSLLAQHGGASAAQAYKLLVQTGPFAGVSPADFAALLRAMGAKDLLKQDHDGTLVLGFAGERIVNRYEFYAVFASQEEWKLMWGGRPLGTIPLVDPLSDESFVVFGGKRWKVVAIEEARKIIDVVPSPGGKPPKFAGSGGAAVHDEVRKEMLRVYHDVEVPSFLDLRAKELLAEGRDNFRRLGLDRSVFVTRSAETQIFVWRGDRVHGTLLRALQRDGATVASTPLTLVLDRCDVTAVRGRLQRLAAAGLPTATELAEGVNGKERNKYDHILPDELLTADYASDVLDVRGAMAWIGEVVGGGGEDDGLLRLRRP
jgi:ATP-dependent Lhr-like helicase